ncbi:MAG TPA: HAMP domain-containing histidine kinase [Candidatus Gallacutalibacter stercoravium]|nr:HAMP domain-containing histidine kinase [Candidatus Gallacutalibacter stercoravium]
MKGITKRWLLNSLGLILLILIALVICFAYAVRNYYYNGIQQAINGQASGLTGTFSGLTLTPSAFVTQAREYVENFQDKERMELMVFNSNDQVVTTSTGFEPDEQEIRPDYEEARQSESAYGTWTGRLSSGERVMAVTQAIYSGDTYLGAFRFVVSLEVADRRIFLSVAGLLLVGTMVIFFVVLSSSYFIRSIVNPIQEVSATAKRIAQGDFNARINKHYDDEIGELCDIINDMANELGVAEKMKNDFISSVSHELRTPLTAIKGWAETMQISKDVDPKMLEKGMGVIINESERLSGIVEELLDFSRMQTGRMVLMVDKIDLLAELDEAVYMFRERALSERKHLLFDEPEMVPPVLGDKNRLRQVFVNIIDNALKYTLEDGVVSIHVKEDGDMLRVSISDNGCGIPAVHLPRIKEKFYKANQTQRGSGIGLAVADEIMQLHSGSLQIESEEGVGTTVIISIPIMKTPQDDAGATQKIE